MKNNSNLNELLDDRISAVIPNYNGQHLLKKFLPFVLETLRDDDELVVVDDQSTDHSVGWLIKKFNLKLIKKSFYKNEIPKNYNPNLYDLEFKLYANKIVVKNGESNKKNINILLVSQSVNLRFAATANIGVIMAKNPRILLLNNDVQPTKNVTKQLLNHFADSNVFAVGCLEYEKNKLGDKSGKNKLWFSKGLFNHSKADNFRSGKTAWVSGGSGMFDKYKWLELGGFDKRFYPAYWEDIDLSFRARKRGWKVLFDENAVVYHVHESTNDNEFGKKKINDMSWKNADKFTKKNSNWWQKLLFMIYQPYWTYRRQRTLIKNSL